LALVVLSVVEQRLDAVRAVLDGAEVTEVAARMGVHRSTVHRWVTRYLSGQLAGLADRSHRPHSSPQQAAELVEAAVAEMRREHPRWGSRRIRLEMLRRPGPWATEAVEVPSERTIDRILHRHGLLRSRPRKRPKDSYRRFERPGPMQLWQTSDRSMVSSGLGDWLPECFGVVVGLASGEAAVKLAEVAVEQVAQRCGMAVAGGPAAVVVGTRGW